MADHEETARQAVRDELARRQKDPAWLARTAPADPGTINDFLEGKRWPRLSTLAKIDDALGWTPGTIDRIRRGQSGPTRGPRQATLLDALNVDEARAMTSAVEAALARTLDEWAMLKLAAQQAQEALAAVEAKRTHYSERLADLRHQLADLEAEAGGDVAGIDVVYAAPGLGGPSGLVVDMAPAIEEPALLGLAARKGTSRGRQVREQQDDAAENG